LLSTHRIPGLAKLNGLIRVYKQLKGFVYKNNYLNIFKNCGIIEKMSKIIRKAGKCEENGYTNSANNQIKLVVLIF